MGSLLIVFLLISGSAAVADACVRAVTLTKNLMLGLIPLLGTAVAFVGDPAAAFSAQTLVFSFAEGIGVLFADLIVPLVAVGAAFGAAAAVSPVGGLEKFSSMLNKIVTWGMALVTGVFSSVLGMRGVIAGAADAVNRKGLRFVISGAVPVVGSAVGDALSSLSASLSLIKNSAGVLGIMAAAFINLPAAAGLLVWKLLLSFLSLSAELFEIKKIPGFIGVLTAAFNAVLAVMVFNAVVYVIAMAILISVKTY